MKRKNKSYLKFFFHAIILLFFGRNIQAQETVFQWPDVVNDIVQDQNGHIYLVTSNSICEFEGQDLSDNCIEFSEFVAHGIVISDNEFITANENRIAYYKNGFLVMEDELSDLITCLAWTKNTLFVGTASEGLYCYAAHNPVRTKVADILDVAINDLDVSDSNLLIALDDGVGILNESHDGGYIHVDIQPGLITQIAAANADFFYAFSHFGQVYRINTTGKIELEKRILSKAIEEASYSLGELYLISSDSVFQMDEGLNIKPILSGTFNAVFVYQNLLFLAQDNRLLQYDITQHDITTVKDNFAVFIESENKVWVGGKGEVSCVDEDDNVIQKIILSPGSVDVKVTTLLVTENRLFVGTLGDGIYVFSKDGIMLNHLLVNGEENRKNVLQIDLVDGKLWVAYLTGLLTLNLENYALVDDYEAFLGKQYLYCFLPVSGTEFFVGTSGKGIMHFENGEVNTLLEGKTVYTLERHEGALIAGTENSGVYSILLDSNQYGVGKKISILNEALAITSFGDNLLIAAENTNEICHVLEGENYHLPNATLHNLNINACAQSDRFIYLGYINGIKRLNKKRLEKLGSLSIQIREKRVFDNLVDGTSGEFDHTQNTFTFKYHTQNFYQSQNTYYKYRLIGVDSSWQLSSQTVTNYYNLGSGSYSFQVAAGIGTEFNPANFERFDFVIKKPFWETVWFWIFVIIVLASSIFGIVKYREKKLVQTEKEKQARLKFEFDSLKNQIDPHFLFNSLNSLIGLIEENPSLATASVEHLADLYRNVLKFQLIDHIPVATELEIAFQYFHINSIRYHDLLALELDKNSNHEGFVIPMCCQFLIENAIKHNVISKTNVLTIKIYVESDYLVVENNKTLKKVQRTVSGLGLLNLKQRYQFITSKPVIIQDESDKFTVKLPIVYDKLNHS